MNDRRQQSIATNEATFRQVNETVEAAARRAERNDPVSFVCECGEDGCAEEVLLTVADYETVRAVPTHFVVRPGHVKQDVEVVVERAGGYWIVEKLGAAADIAEETDPRP